LLMGARFAGATATGTAAAASVLMVAKRIGGATEVLCVSLAAAVWR
jgi:dTDP-4-amino-4,6-dideoxygalactose transaminase